MTRILRKYVYLGHKDLGHKSINLISSAWELLKMPGHLFSKSKVYSGYLCITFMGK